MVLKTRLSRLESFSPAFSGLAAHLKEVQLNKKLGLPTLTLTKTEEELNIIIATSKTRFQDRLANILLRRFSV